MASFDPASIDADSIPGELKAHNLWVVFKAVKKENGKIKKPPFCAKTGIEADIYNKQNLCDFETAYKTALNGGGYDGIGTRIPPGFVGIDIDNCIDDAGNIDAIGQKILDYFPKTYAEISPSTRGLRIFVQGEKPSKNCRTSIDNRSIEFYGHDSQYLTVTGHKIENATKTIGNGQDGLTRCFEALFKVSEKHTEKQAGISPQTQESGLTDAEILSKLRRAKNAARFEELWRGGGNASDGDLGLCAMIAFYTQDSGQIDRIFRQSARMREKWDERRGGVCTESKQSQKRLQA